MLLLCCPGGWSLFSIGHTLRNESRLCLERRQVFAAVFKVAKGGCGWFGAISLHRMYCFITSNWTSAAP